MNMNIFFRRYFFRLILFVPLLWLLVILVLLQSNEVHSPSPKDSHDQILVRRPGREADGYDAFGGDALAQVGQRLIPQTANHSSSREGPRLIHDKNEQVAAPIHFEKPNPNAPGEMGKGYDVNKDQLPPDQLKKYNEGLQNNAFNAYLSDMISIHRSLPDVRDPGCRKINYTATSITASVVMCFHNEAWSVLLRSIHSILDRSPPHLLKEIIIVDDFSDMRESMIDRCFRISPIVSFPFSASDETAG